MDITTNIHIDFCEMRLQKSHFLYLVSYEPERYPTTYVFNHTSDKFNLCIIHNLIRVVYNYNLTVPHDSALATAIMGHGQILKYD